MRKIITVVGVSGSGKSRLVKDKLLPLMTRPIFILDSQGEYSDGVIFGSVEQIIECLNYGANISGRYILRAHHERSIEALFELVDGLGNCTLICDEPQGYFGTSGASEALSNIVATGRHRDISVVFVCRRFAEISRNGTAQSNSIVSFKQHEPVDIALLKKLSIEGERVAELGKWEYLVLGEDIAGLY